jgi:GT2 family glycosyltransferase
VQAPPPPPGLGPGAAPTFSVIVPVYQAADTIAESIESILGQTAPPLEIVVVDDGSTDGLEAAIAPYLERIVLIRQENQGGAAAMNTAASHATGDFVAILDADDAYLPGRLEALGRMGAERPDLDLLAADAYFELDGKIVGRVYESRSFPVQDQRRAILEWCFMFNPAVRRSRLLDIGGFDATLRIGYDWDCWLRLIIGGSRAGLVPEPLTRYRHVSGSLSDDRPRSLRARVTILEKARANPELRPEEIPIIAESLSSARHRAALAEARYAIRSGAGSARKAALAVAFGPRMSVGTRAKALVASVSPGVARRLLDRRPAEEKHRFPSGNA